MPGAPTPLRPGATVGAAAPAGWGYAGCASATVRSGLAPKAAAPVPAGAWEEAGPETDAGWINPT